MYARSLLRAGSHLCRSWAGVSCHRLYDWTAFDVNKAFDVLGPKTPDAEEARQAVLMGVLEIAGKV